MLFIRIYNHWKLREDSSVTNNNKRFFEPHFEQKNEIIDSQACFFFTIDSTCNKSLHDIFTQFGKISSDYTKQLKLIDDREMSIFKSCNNIYTNYLSVKALVIAAIQNPSIASFIKPPASWENFSINGLNKKKLVNPEDDESNEKGRVKTR